MTDSRVWTEKIYLPTYKLLGDDLNPMLDASLDPYPYTRQVHKSNEIEDVEYDAVILENAYLKLTVLPELGGRLYSAYDKINLQEVFYKNEVIKPRMIATRGAWISGGIEFNFPISHSPTTMDRVNHQTRVYPDGSAAVEFGSIELISGMNWKVELRLYKDKASIEQNVKLYNPTRTANRFYFWTNAAVPYEKSVKLIYPFDWCINCFDDEYIKWPFYKGRDYSNPREVPYAYETFGKLMMQDFFGSYSMERQYGVVHYADRKVLKGAKFFIWGNDRYADAWNASLTDDDSQYLEIQSGPFETQSVYKFMKPHQRLGWSEYWYPVAGMGGFTHAEKTMAVNFEPAGSGVRVIFYCAEKLDDCTVIFKANGSTVTRNMNFECGKARTELFETEGCAVGGDFTLDVYGAAGHLLSYGTRAEFSNEKPELDLFEDSRVVRGKNYSEKAVDHAAYLDSHGKSSDAAELYRKQLEARPDCTVTLNRLGNVLLKQGLAAQAADCFKIVLSYDNRNAEARFALASALKQTGDYAAARRLFTDIACDSEFWLPSVAETAKLNMWFGYFKDASDLLESCGPETEYIRFLKSAAFRADSLPERAKAFCESSSGVANEYILAERYLLGSDVGAETFLKYTSGDERIILMIALEYADMGLREDAEKILALSAQSGIKADLLRYAMRGGSFPEIFDSPLDRVFINEPQLTAVLEREHSAEPSGAASYLLGVYFHAKGRKDEALALYEEAYQKGLRYTVLLRNLGLLYFIHKNEPDIAEKYLAEDLTTNGSMNESTLDLLHKIYVGRNDIDARVKLLPHMEKVRNRSLLLIPMIETLRDSGRTEEALHMLANEEFENWEGAEHSGRCYKETLMMLAEAALDRGDPEKALEYAGMLDIFPKGLNYGNHVRAPRAEEYHMKGRVLSACGRESEAAEAFKAGAVELHGDEMLHTAKSREYAMKCLTEYKKRSFFTGDK